MEPGRQFSLVVHPTPKGMEYQRAPGGAMKRMAVIDPQEPIKQVENHRRPNPDDYYSPEVRQTRKATGEPLKRAKISPNPKVAIPQTVAFADYHEEHYGDTKSLYVDYVSSRQRGHHHADRLIQAIAAQHPEHEINFGKVMNEGIWRSKENLAAQGRQVRGHRDF